MLDGLPITIIDTIILVVIILSAGLAAVRGFVREFLSILSWAGAALIAIYGYPYIYPFAQPYAAEITREKIIIDAGIVVILFVLSLAILSIVSSILSSRVKESTIGPLDRAVGFLFGAARGIFLVCLVYIGTNFIWEEPNFPAMVTSSKSYPLIKTTSGKLLDILPAEYQAGGNKAINNVKKKLDEANEYQKQYEKLSNPLPSIIGNTEEPSYGDDDRSQLENLINDTQ